MKQLTEFTNDPYQKLTIVNEDNSTFVLELQFITQQQYWLYSITYGSFVIVNRMLVYGPNFLRQFQNQIPFGLMCYTNEGDSPFQITDLQNQRAKIYLLTAAEVAEIETDFYE